MKKIFALVMLLCASASAVAGPCTITAEGLPEAEIQRLEQVCLDAVAANPAANTLATAKEAAKEASNWGSMAKDVAGAIGIAARELGVATNEFLATPAGTLVAGLIVWKIGGEQILAVIVCFPLIFVTLYVTARLRQSVLVDKVTYEPFPVLWGLWSFKRRTGIVYKTERGLSEGEAFFGWAIYPLAGGLACLMLVLAMI